MEEKSQPIAVRAWAAREGFNRPSLAKWRLIDLYIQRLPRWFGAGLCLAFFALVTIAGLWLGPQGAAMIERITRIAGVQIGNVTIVGRDNLNRADLVAQLQLKPGAALPFYNTGKAKDRISALNWVERVSIRKVYPNSLHIEIMEHKPFMRWLDNGKAMLVTRAGQIIASAGEGRFSHLPRIAGEQAQQHGAEIIDAVAEISAVHDKVLAYRYISQRRWNLVLQGGVTVMLPQHEFQAAIHRLARLERRDGLLSRDILSVDMRLADRVVVRLPKPVATAHQQAVAHTLPVNDRAKQGTGI